MKKGRQINKLLALLLCMSLMLVTVAGTFSTVSAAEVEPAPLGTYEDGYSSVELAGKENATLAAGIFSELQNFDFSEGLVNWTSRDFEYASKYAQPKEENGKTYVTLTASDYQGIGSMGFRLEDVEPGDVLALMADFRGDSKLQLKLEHANYTCASEDGLVRTNGAKVVYPASDEKGWSTAVSETSMVLSDYSKDDNSIARFGDGFVFYVRVQSQDTQVVTDITNIRVVKVLEDGSYTELDGTPIVFYDEYGDVYDPDAGTREDGFTTEKGAVNGIKPHMGFANGDFSQGLKNWTATGNPGDYASKRAEPKTEGDKSYITLISEGNYEGILSRPFHIEGIEPGDKLVLMAEYRGDGKLQLVLEQANPTNYDNTCRANGIKPLYTARNPENWSIGVSNTHMVVQSYNTDPGAVALYGEGYCFTVRVQSDKDPVTSDIANVRIVKLLDDGSYETLDGEPIIIRDEDGDVYVPNSGTRADGFAVNGGNVTNLGALEEFTNSDFSLGLKFWTTTSGQLASTMAAPKTENGKPYITFSSPGGYSGIRSRGFRIKGVEVGDVLAVMVDYRGSEKLQLKLEYPNNTTGGQANWIKTVYTSPDANGWNTAVSSERLTVGPYNEEVANQYGNDFFFYVSLQSQDTSVVADIANVRIVKVLEDGSFETVEGERLNASAKPYYGTAEDGIFIVDQNKDLHNMEALEPYMNFDFSEGLKYWAPRVSLKGYASDYAVVEDGALKVTDIPTQYNGLSSMKFSLPERARNKKLIFSCDIKSNGHVGFGFSNIGYGTEGNWINIVENGTGDEWKHVVISDDRAIIPENVTEVTLNLQLFSTETKDKYFYIDNISICIEDEGGIDGMLSDIYGAPVGYEYGDVNADSAVDIRDLIRLKKYLADKSGVSIYLAAANTDNSSDSTIDALDLAALKKQLIMK